MALTFTSAFFIAERRSSMVGFLSKRRPGRTTSPVRYKKFALYSLHQSRQLSRYKESKRVAALLG